MSVTKLVRASRDGDQFHYVWAARRCLLLISPSASLKVITIEGASPSEVAESRDHIEAGEEVIDVGEYYGSASFEEAKLVRYIQVKHSTLRCDTAWKPSELEKTFRNFAERYKAFKKKFRTINIDEKLEFLFISNRRISNDFSGSIQDIVEGNPARHADSLKKVEKYTGLSGDALVNFCSLLRLEGNQDGLWEQHNSLIQDVSKYLPDVDVDAPIHLKELVTRKALSASTGSPEITKMDVLRALKTDESRLYPAPCLIEDLEKSIPREQESDIIQEILGANNSPVIIHATAGVGKSIFATRLKLRMPEGSLGILYDCFGNGQYRSPSGYRHRHRDALVQIANELAAEGLCHPLVPSPHADSSDYMKVFIHRLGQSIDSLRSKNRKALLCIIIDAADNAQMAAEEVGEKRSFICDLIREKLPVGARLVVLCRSHRMEYLDPPPKTLKIELQPFSRTETAIHLRHVFADATEQDVDEFHRLSSSNPRLQARALSQKVTLNEILRALGPNPTTVDEAIEGLLDTSIARLRDEAIGLVEKTQINKICMGLAVLRPWIPLSVLASLSGVCEVAIKSLVLELGSSLLLAGDAIQFLDEPAETWFKKRFKPTPGELAAFVENLKPLAVNSAYVASVLPQLMLGAGMFNELIELALTSQALPSANPVERRNVELQRLQFALKACLREKRYTDAVKLALKAGGECAGDERQCKLLQENTDLASAFLGSDNIQELVSRKTFGSGWLGSHHAYEAALLSERSELLGEARSRLRMSYEWLQNWSQLSIEEKRKEKISYSDILEIAVANYNIHGAAVCANDLRNWRPREVISFRVGRMLAKRFIDHARYQDLNGLALAAGNNIYLVLAITLELQEVHRLPPKSVVERTLRLASSPHIKLKDDDSSEGTTIQAVTALVEAAYNLSVCTADDLVMLLTRYLPASPPRDLTFRYGRKKIHLLRAYTLRAALSNHSLSMLDLAHDELHKKLESPEFYSESRDVREFKNNIGLLIPWYLLWAATFLGRISSAELIEKIKKLKAKSLEMKMYDYHSGSDIFDEIARIWFEILWHAEDCDIKLLSEFDHWITSLKQPLFTTTLTYLTRGAARLKSLESRALEYANTAFEIIRDVREDAESKSASYVAIARAVLTLGHSEAAAYFKQAVEIASRVGDENLDRWGALLDLADRAACKETPNSLLAFKFARCAELTYDYVYRDKHFDWEATVEAISGLCGRSSFAILSRWRDRNFGDAERLLPIAVNYLVTQGSLGPMVALALTCFRAQWNRPLLLEIAMSFCVSRAEKETVLGFAHHYMTLTKQSARKWIEFKRIIVEHNLVLPGVDERISFCEREEQSYKPRDNSYVLNHEVGGNKDDRDWIEIFQGLNLSNANDISKAYRRLKSQGAPFYHERFFKEASHRVQVGKEAEFVIGLANVADFDLYHLNCFFKKMPDNWKIRLSVREAFAKTLKVFCRRYCMEIVRSRYYEIFPLKNACELLGVSEDEVIDEVLAAIGDTAEVADTNRLFTIVGLIAPKLTKSEAMEALSFGLELFDPLLKETDGDGPWLPKFEPPAEIEGSVAGYIWGSLASPRLSLRWEAAHVVRAICTLNNKITLKHLILLANGAPASAFCDANLYFYKMHAKQWLLIGLARAARECPDVIAPYVDYLFSVTFGGEPHVLIREFAKRTIIALLDAGSLGSQKDLRHCLASVNRSLFPTVQSKFYQRFDNRVGCDYHGTYADDDERFYFSPDIGPYWFRPLGRCFAKTENIIEDKVLSVIKSDWQLSGRLRWSADERQVRKIFGDMETHHSHGSYPRVDSLGFYLSYHAMMVVAGKLLATMPVHHDPDLPEDEFFNWLCRHDLTRMDGGWLADRRDPLPLERPAWKDEKETEMWRWQIKRDDFDKILLSPDGRLSLWGHWTWVSGRREESINVYSALVSSERSTALLRALQSVGNPRDYRIPEADDDLEIGFNGFHLKGWVSEKTVGGGNIDEQDPWSGDISYPSPQPAAYIINLMNLKADAEKRQWVIQGDSRNVVWSRIWGEFKDKDGVDWIYERGERLQASFGFIVLLLCKLKMDLIVEVGIERCLRYYEWERSKKDDIGLIPPSTRLFIVKANGNIETL